MIAEVDGVQFDPREMSAADVRRYAAERETAGLRAWRAIMAEMTAGELAAVGVGLVADDPTMTWDETEPAGEGCESAACVGACAIGWGAWKGRGLVTVGEVREYIRRVRRAAEARIGRDGRTYYPALAESDGVEQFEQWYGDTDAEVVRLRLLAEVQRELRRRASGR